MPHPLMKCNEKYVTVFMPKRTKVERVSDGDTLIASTGNVTKLRIRLLDTDAS